MKMLCDDYMNQNGNRMWATSPYDSSVAYENDLFDLRNNYRERRMIKYKIDAAYLEQKIAGVRSVQMLCNKTWSIKMGFGEI
mgnify:CR=1 FL=1